MKCGCLHGGEIVNGRACNPLSSVPVLVHVQVWVHIQGDPQSVQLRNATTTTPSQSLKGKFQRINLSNKNTILLFALILTLGLTWRYKSNIYVGCSVGQVQIASHCNFWCYIICYIFRYACYKLGRLSAILTTISPSYTLASAAGLCLFILNSLLSPYRITGWHPPQFHWSSHFFVMCTCKCMLGKCVLSHRAYRGRTKEGRDFFQS